MWQRMHCLYSEHMSHHILPHIGKKAKMKDHTTKIFEYFSYFTIYLVIRNRSNEGFDFWSKKNGIVAFRFTIAHFKNIVVGEP